MRGEIKSANINDEGHNVKSAVAVQCANIIDEGQLVKSAGVVKYANINDYGQYVKSVEVIQSANIKRKGQNVKYVLLIMLSLICFSVSTLNKINHSIEYLGCDVETLRKHIQDKMTDQMTFDNIHYDHIKPVSCFNLDNEEEFLKCCHFTNLQPLLVKDNLELHNKWTEENEIFWNEHIIYKPDYKDLYKI